MDMNDNPLDNIEKAEVVRLEPGDVLVVSLHSVVSQQQGNNVAAALYAKFPNNEVLVTAGGVVLTVVRPLEHAPVRTAEKE